MSSFVVPVEVIVAGSVLDNNDSGSCLKSRDSWKVMKLYVRRADVKGSVFAITVIFLCFIYFFVWFWEFNSVIK